MRVRTGAAPDAPSWAEPVGPPAAPSTAGGGRWFAQSQRTGRVGVDEQVAHHPPPVAPDVWRFAERTGTRSSVMPSTRV